MPRELKELGNFNFGTIFTSSEEDIPENGNAFSLNVDPLSKAGVLNGINSDRFVTSLSNPLIELVNPVVWNKTDDIDVEDSSAIVGNDIRFIGSKGILERLHFTALQPYLSVLKDSGGANLVIRFDTEIDSGEGVTTIYNNQGSGTTTSSFHNYIESGDIIQISTDTTINAKKEILIINSKASDGNSFEVARGAYGSPRTSFAQDTTYNVLVNVVKFGSAYERTKRAVLKSISGWSAYEGNHLGGNASINYSGLSANHSLKISATDYNITFDATAKTMVFLSKHMGSEVYTLPNLPDNLLVGDVFSIWTAVADANNSTQFKVMAIDAEAAASGATITFHLDSAPTAGAHTSGDFYFEPGLIQNQTFHWKHDTDYPYNWEETFRGIGNLGIDGEAFTTSDNAAGTDVAQVAAGGYYDSTDLSLYGLADSSTSYYPFDGSDAYMKLMNDVTVLPTSISTASAIDAIQTTIFSNTTSVSNYYIRAGDVLKIDSEFMKVVSAELNVITVIRGFYGSTAAAHGAQATTSVACHLNNATNETIVIIATDGTSKTYTAKATTTVASGFFDASGNATATANALELCIIADENGTTGGHAGRITVVNNGSGTLALTQTVNGLAGNTTWTSTLTGTSSGAFSGGTDEIAMYNVNFNGITQTIPESLLEQGAQYRLSFKAKDTNAAADGESGGEGSIRIKYGGLYANNQGGADIITPVDSLTALIPFTDLVHTESSYDVSNSGLDFTWRTLHYDFTIDRTADLSNGLRIEFLSSGPEDTYIGIDLVTLNRKPDLLSTNDTFGETGNLDSIGYINHGDSRDIITFDGEKQKLSMLQNFGISNTLIQSFTHSAGISSEVSSNKKRATFASNNQEVHIGFGSHENDTPPLWLGYLNRKVFGVDYSNALYLDKDSPANVSDASSAYGLGGNALHKLAPAGEFEKVGVASWDSGSSKELVVDHVAHSLNTGDNIVIREYMDIDNSWDGNGVWVVTDGDPDDTFDCKRFTPALGGIDNDPTGLPANSKISYRPYYYYAITRGGETLFRVFPDVKINNTATGLDENYPMGHVQPNTSIDASNIISICPSYNKLASGLGGGQLYVLEEVLGTPKISKVDTMVKYDEWEDSNLAIDVTYEMIYRNFKWSNEVGDLPVVDTDKRFGYVPKESVGATINPPGPSIVSDILETKGPNEVFEYTETDNSDDALAPAAFDTRLWLQFSPGEAEYFVEGDRFLFCGKTNANDAGSTIIDMADRTPPTQVFFGSYMPIAESYHASLSFGENENSSGYRQLGGPGLSIEAGSLYYGPHASKIGWGTWLGKYGEEKDYEEEGFTKEHVAQRGFYASDVFEHGQRTSTQNSGPWLRVWRAGYSLARFQVRTSSGIDSSSYDNSYNWTTAMSEAVGEPNRPVYFNMTNLGDNMGWNKECRIYVAFYGLFQMSDNDGDGVIDGTGLVTKSAHSSIAGKPYGELEKKVSSHCVGILGGTGTDWWAGIGKKTQMLSGSQDSHYRLAGISGANEMWWFTGHRGDDNDGNTNSYEDRYYKTRFYNHHGFYNTLSLRLSMRECIFICSDVNFGDYIQQNKYVGISSIEAYAWGHANTHATRINTSDSHYLQAGDLVYLESTGGSDSNIFGTVGDTAGDGISYYVAAVLSDTAFVVTHGTNEGLAARNNTTQTNGRVYFGGFRRISWLSSTTSSAVGLMEESSRGGEGKTGFHFDYNENDYGDGGIYTQGQYGASWYSESFNIGHPGIAAYFDRTTPPWQEYPGTEIGAETVHAETDRGAVDKRRDDAIFPETLFRFDRLNTSCGYMIRAVKSLHPPHISDFGFMSDKISVSVPCFPNPIQHKGVYNSGDTENQYSSYILISSSNVDEQSSTVRDSSRITIKQYAIPTFGSTTFVEDTAYPMSKMYYGTSSWGNGTPTDVAWTSGDPAQIYYADMGEQSIVSSSGSIGYRLRNTTNPGKNYIGTRGQYIATGTTAASGYINSNDAAHPDAAIHPKLIVHGDQGSLWNYTEASPIARSQTSAKTFRDVNLTSQIGHRSFYRTRNVFAGCYIVIMNQIRKIIGSYSLGTANTNDMVFVINYPIIGTVDDNTTYRIYSGASMCHSGVSSNVTSPRSQTYFGYTPSTSGQLMDSSGTSGEIILTENSSYDSELDTTGGWRVGDKVSLISTSELLPEDGDVVLFEGEFEITREVNFDAFAIQGESGVVYKDAQTIQTRLENDDSGMKNPIISEAIGSGPMHATFGGLDMRNISNVVTSGTTSDISAALTSDGAGLITATTDINHGLKSEDLVTLISQTANKEMEGSYIITVPQGSTTTFTFKSTNTTNLGDDYFVLKDSVELFQAIRNGDVAISKIRAGDRVWDTGNVFSNALRQDKDKELNQVKLSEEFAQRIVGVGKDSDDSFFKAASKYEYKLSFIYDGYQESPLSGVFATQFDVIHSYERLEILVEVDTALLSKRISDIAIYRKDEGGMYKLVKALPTKDGWTSIVDKTQVFRVVEDDGAVGASYESRSGLSELMSDAGVKYGISKAMDGYLFVGNCSHKKIDDASNLIFRSLPGKYSIFNWFVDFIQLPTTPVAMANFLGRLYVFDNNNIYKINPHNMAIEDTFEGIGCISKDSVIVTEYGMFFADRNGAYMHNGQVPVKISTPIQSGGKTDMLSISNASSTGVTTVEDISWENTVLADGSMPPYVSFLSNKECVLFIVELKSVDSNGHYFSKYLAWSYQITFKRWDLWTLCENEKPGIPFIGKKGEVFISIGNALYEYLGAKGRKPFTWLSKKLSMEQDTVTKVFKNIKINGSLDRLNYSGTLGNFSNDRIIVTTDAGRLDSSSLTYSTESNETSKYALTGANRKGKWMQIKLEDIDNPIDSIGILFRRRKVK